MTDEEIDKEAASVWYATYADAYDEYLSKGLSDREAHCRAEYEADKAEQTKRLEWAKDEVKS